MTGRRLERLGADHELFGFQLGNAEVDSCLVRHALAAQQMDTADAASISHPAADESGSASRR